MLLVRCDGGETDAIVLNELLKWMVENKGMNNWLMELFERKMKCNIKNTNDNQFLSNHFHKLKLIPTTSFNDSIFFWSKARAFVQEPSSCDSVAIVKTIQSYYNFKTQQDSILKISQGKFEIDVNIIHFVLVFHVN